MFKSSYFSRDSDVELVVSHYKLHPQLIASEASYWDILKAALLTVVPNVARGGRADMWLQSIVHAPASGGAGYVLSPGSENNYQAFEKFVLENELNRGAESPFFKIWQYLEYSEKIDRYVIAQCALLFMDDIVKNIQALQRDVSIKEMFFDNSAKVAASECIDLINDLINWHLTSYLTEKLKIKFRETDLDNEDDQAYMKHALRGIQITNLCTSLRNIFHVFTVSSNIFSIDIDEYIASIKYNIILGIAPAVTEEDKRRQEAVYVYSSLNRKLVTQEINQRKAQAIKERYPRLASIIERMQSGEEVSFEGSIAALGLDEDQTLSDLVCNDYSFPDHTFQFKKLSKYSIANVCVFFFISNIYFFKRINKEKSGEALYILSFLYLWRRFANNHRCPPALKNMNSNVIKELGENVALQLSFHTLDQVIRTGIVSQETVNEFSAILYDTAYSDENDRLFLLAIILSSSASKVTLNFDEERVLMHLNIRLHVEQLDRFSGVKAMRVILACQLPLPEKLKFISSIARGKAENNRKKAEIVKHLYMNLSKMFDAKENIYSQSLGESQKRFYEAVSVSSLSQLLSAYAIKKESSMAAFFILHIEHFFNRKQLMLLAEGLRRFLPPSSDSRASVERKSPDFFQAASVDLSTVVDMIDQEASIVEILTKLHTVVSREKRKNQGVLQEPYDSLSMFLSSKPTPENTTDNFIANITTIVPNAIKNESPGKK